MSKNARKKSQASVPQKSLNEIVAFFNNQSYDEIIRQACEKADMLTYYDDICKLVKPSILLLTKPEDSCDRVVGISKVGGRPDVPRGFEWPKKGEINLSFLVQINCEDLPSSTSKLLPKKGLISFFFAFDNDLKCTYPDNKGCGKVYYFEDEELMKVPNPDHVKEFKPCEISYINYPSLPYVNDYYSTELWEMDFLQEEEYLDDGYSNIVESIEQLSGLSGVSYSKERHQLFGYPRSVQGENIELKIAKARLNSDKAFKELSNSELQKVFDQKLLLQVNEDSNADIQLIDGGKIYFVGEEKNEKFNDDLWTCVDFG